MTAVPRAALRALPGAQFFSIQSRRLRRGALRQADGLLRNGRPGPHGSAMPLDAPYDWDAADVADHGLAVVDPLLEAYSWSGKAEYLVPAVAVALDWIRRGREAQAAGVPAAAGHRAYRLAYLTRAAAREGAVADEELDLLVETASGHAEALLSVGESGPVAAAAGLAALVGYLGPVVARLEELDEQSRLQARRAFEARFRGDGVHVSRSPARHAALTATLGSLLDADLVDGSELADLRLRAEDALAWLTMPDGRLAAFGATGEVLASPVWSSRGTAPHLLRDRVRSPALLHAATAGAMGCPGGSRWRVFGDADYAICRSHWPESRLDRDRSGYLAITGARRPDVGQQADALSFVWFDAGRLLLGDAGQVVGTPRDPEVDETVAVGGGGADELPPAAIVRPAAEDAESYVRATRAHNTVEIDGADQEPCRDGPVAAMTRSGEIRGVSFLDARIDFEEAVHRRSLAWAPGEWLAVVDRLATSSGRHRYRQWFHAADSLDVTERDGQFLLGSEGVPVAWAAPLAGRGDPMTAVRGRDGEHTQGWWSPGSPGLIPAWAFGWEDEGEETVLAAVFSLCGRVAPLRLDAGRLGWTAAGRRVVITMERHGIADLETFDEEDGWAATAS